ncbi:MAG: hypothetical protein ABIR47_14865 [Candidatus Kapaibacterium sp.]
MERIRTVRVLSIFSLAFLLLAIGCKHKPDDAKPAADSTMGKVGAQAGTPVPNTWKWVNGQIKYTISQGNVGGAGIYERGNWAELVTVSGPISDTVENCQMGGVKDIPLTAGVYMITPKFYHGACPAIPDSMFTAPTSVDTITGRYIIRLKSPDTNNVSIDISLVDTPPTSDRP